jgi:hypothetical protein
MDARCTAWFELCLCSLLAITAHPQPSPQPPSASLPPLHMGPHSSHLRETLTKIKWGRAWSMECPQWNYYEYSNSEVASVWTSGPLGEVLPLTLSSLILPSEPVAPWQPQHLWLYVMQDTVLASRPSSLHLCHAHWILYVTHPVTARRL